jgi:hypothetical protein
MTNQHRATPKQWETIEQYGTGSSDPYSCILELRARIEALEAAQQPHQDKLDRLIAIDRDDPADSLIDRVAQAIYEAPNTHEGWRSEARAAILEVAAWMRAESEGHLGSGLHFARRLQQEANR